MLASAWKIVSDSLNALAVDGVLDGNVKMKLKNNPDIRERYLVLYDMVNVLVKMSQDRFSVLATTTRAFHSSLFSFLSSICPLLPNYSTLCEILQIQPSRNQ
jgi:hypothetical protein